MLTFGSHRTSSWTSVLGRQIWILRSVCCLWTAENALFSSSRQAATITFNYYNYFLLLPPAYQTRYQRYLSKLKKIGTDFTLAQTLHKYSHNVLVIACKQMLYMKPSIQLWYVESLKAVSRYSHQRSWHCCITNNGHANRLFPDVCSGMHIWMSYFDTRNLKLGGLTFCWTQFI